MAIQSVTYAPNRFNYLRFIGGIFDETPQSHDEIVDRARICVVLQAPNVFENAATRDRFAGIVEQIFDQFRLHQCKSNRLISGFQL